MKKHIGLFMLALSFMVLVLWLPACSGDDDGDDVDGDDSDGDVTDGDNSDGDVADGDDSDGDNSDGDVTDGDAEIQTEFVFRAPRSDAYLCEDPNMGDVTMGDIDHLCLIQYEDLDIELYVQSTPTSCTSDFWPTPVYTTEAWIKRDGTVSSLPNVGYDHGGNHHNDWINFVLDARNYQLWHSSIGSGWRRCAPVDCMIICKEGMSCGQDGEGTSIELDGCERNAGDGKPPVPVICMEMPADGSRPDFIDPWEAWEGDEYYPLLPCSGEESVMTR